MDITDPSDLVTAINSIIIAIFAILKFFTKVKK